MKVGAALLLRSILACIFAVLCRSIYIFSFKSNQSHFKDPVDHLRASFFATTVQYIVNYFHKK